MTQLVMDFKQPIDHCEKHRDYWDDTGQIFFTEGKGYGITPTLAGVCLGKEHEILSYLEGGDYPLNITNAACDELERVKELKETLENERRETTIIPKSSNKLGAVKVRGERIRLTPATKHRAKHLKRT